MASAEEKAPIYGQTAIRMAEADRAAKLEAEKARYRALLLNGPTLTLPGAQNFHFSFNPSTLISLGDRHRLSNLPRQRWLGDP